MTRKTNEWGKESLTATGLPKYLSDYMVRFMPIALEFSISIILTGSFARSTASSESDVDILVVVQEEKSRKRLRRALNREQLGQVYQKRVADVKILTKSELMEQAEGTHNFIAWSLLDGSLLLYGEDLRESVKLEPVQLGRLTAGMLDRLNETHQMLEYGTGFQGACMTVVDILNTLYFIQKKIVLKSDTAKSRHRFLQDALGPMVDILLQVYRSSQERLPSFSGLGPVARFRRSHDRRYTTEQYKELLGCVQTVERMTRTIYAMVQDWLDAV